MKVNQDFLLGLFFAVTGIVGGLGALSYPFGSASRMGPGFFPIIIAALLTLTGFAILFRSRLASSLPVETVMWRSVMIVPLTIVIFGLLLEKLGLPLAVFLLLLGTALASVKFELSIRAALGAALFSAICAIVFVKLLGLPIPLAGSWLPLAG